MRRAGASKAILARSPDTGPDSKKLARLVEDEDRREQRAGQDAEPRFAQERMEGRPNLAVPARSEAPFPCVAKVAACRLTFTVSSDLWTGKPLTFLDGVSLRPAKAYLAWHRSNVFAG